MITTSHQTTLAVDKFSWVPLLLFFFVISGLMALLGFFLFLSFFVDRFLYNSQ